MPCPGCIARRGHELEQTRDPQNRSGWLVGAAAAAVILIAIGGLALFATSGGDTAGESETPVEVVEAFFAAWNEGDVDAALGYVTEEERTDLAEILGSTTAVGFSVAAVDCVEGNTPGSVVCSVVKRGPIHDAYYANLGIPTPARSIAQFVSDGLIITLEFGDLEQPSISFENYVRGVDETAFLEHCEPRGLWLSRTCGEWLAQYVDGYVTFMEGS